MKKFLSSLLLSSFLFAGLDIQAQNKDSLRLEQKKKKILELLQTDCSFTPVAHAETPGKKYLKLDLSQNKDPKHPAFFDIGRTLQDAKNSDGIKYIHPNDKEQKTYAIANQDMKIIYDSFIDICTRFNIRNPLLLLVMNSELDVQALIKPKLMRLQWDTTYSPVMITAGMFENADVTSIANIMYHEVEHLKIDQDKNPSESATGQKAEMKADSMAFVMGGYEGMMHALQLSYQIQKQYILKDTSIPMHVALDYMEFERQFGVDARKIHPLMIHSSITFRMLMIDLLNDKQHGDDKLYNKMRKQYNL